MGIRSVNAGMSNVRRAPNPPAESLKVASAGNTARQNSAPKKTAKAECLMGRRSDGHQAPETTTPPRPRRKSPPSRLPAAHESLRGSSGHQTQAPQAPSLEGALAKGGPKSAQRLAPGPRVGAPPPPLLRRAQRGAAASRPSNSSTISCGQCAVTLAN